MNQTTQAVYDRITLDPDLRAAVATTFYEGEAGLRNSVQVWNEAAGKQLNLFGVDWQHLAELHRMPGQFAESIDRSSGTTHIDKPIWGEGGWHNSRRPSCSRGCRVAVYVGAVHRASRRDPS